MTRGRSRWMFNEREARQPLSSSRSSPCLLPPPGVPSPFTRSQGTETTLFVGRIWHPRNCRGMQEECGAARPNFKRTYQSDSRRASRCRCSAGGSIFRAAPSVLPRGARPLLRAKPNLELLLMSPYTEPSSSLLLVSIILRS